MEFVRVPLVLLVSVLLLLFCGFAAARTHQKRWTVDDHGCRTPNAGSGSCKRVSECEPMLEFLKSKTVFTKKEKSALRSYQCGLYRSRLGDEWKVCCPNEPIDLGWTVEEDRCTTQDGNSGVCVKITDCKVLYDFIRENALTNEIKETIIKYRCGESHNQQVCCPSKLPPELEKPKITDFSKHPNYRLLPQDCGVSGATNKITNGNETNLLEFPWAVVLKYNKTVNPWGCGASLISERYVLTAAHCVRSKNTLTTIRLGEHNFNQDPDCEGAELGEDICAEKVQDFPFKKEYAIVHPEYDDTTFHNDIALIRLPKPARLSVDGASSICIPITEAERIRDIKNFTVVGWGATETGFVSPILLKVLVPKVELPDCAPNYASRTQLTDNQLCAGGRREQDSCTGDSGGPLSTDYTFDGRFRAMQYGIVSLGPRICGKEGFPAVYTRVAKYVGWILDNLKP